MKITELRVRDAEVTGSNPATSTYRKSLENKLFLRLFDVQNPYEGYLIYKRWWQFWWRSLIIQAMFFYFRGL